MKVHAEQTVEKNDQSAVNKVAPSYNEGGASIFQFAGHRPETVIQKYFQKMANNSPRTKRLNSFHEIANGGSESNHSTHLQVIVNNRTTSSIPLQKKENKTGLTLSNAPIQRMPVPIAGTEDQFRDNRPSQGNYTLTSLGNGYYEVNDHGATYTVEYFPGSDQYKMALEGGGSEYFWDPVTGIAFKYIDGRTYEAGGNSFIYSKGYYHQVPDNVDGRLDNFLDQVWALRDLIRAQPGLKDKLYVIYDNVYSKKRNNNKAAPALDNSLHLIRDLVAFSVGKNAHLQGGVIIPEGIGNVTDIRQLYELMNSNRNHQSIRDAAYQGLNIGYYYFLINQAIAANVRVILNVVPENVPAALRTLWPIVSASELVQGMKAGGPAAAARKLDSIIIYVRRGDGLPALLAQIERAGIATVNLLPGMVSEQSAGIGVAADPRPIRRTLISFGEKRSILAYMALDRANSQEELRRIGATFFRLAGIDTTNASQETDDAPDASVLQTLEELLTIMRAN